MERLRRLGRHVAMALLAIVSSGGCWDGTPVFGPSWDCESCGVNPRAWAADTVPVHLLSTQTFTDISLGPTTVCGTTSSQTIHCWGRLGDDTTIAPRHYTVSGTFRAPSVSLDFLCATRTSGGPHCWGSSHALGLGVPGTLPPDAPVAVTGGDSLVSVVVSQTYLGPPFACGLTASGEAHCWGADLAGALGRDSVGYSDPVPRPVAGGRRFRSLRLGWGHACGIDPEGIAYCWGANHTGQLGDGTTDFRAVPTEVSGGHRWSFIAPGPLSTCGVTTGGLTYCWGPTLFLRDTRSGFTLVRLASLTTALGHVCGLTASGEAYCWGYNSYGELGVGDRAGHDGLVAVETSQRFTKLVSTAYTTCGLSRDGGLWCWGLDVLRLKEAFP